MQRRCRFWGGLLAVMMVLVISLFATACGDDLYGECSVEEGSACASDDDSVSCVEDDNPDCSSQACARYRGSDPFCTVPCSSDGDCTNGKCVRIELQGSETKYCVADDD